VRFSEEPKKSEQKNASHKGCPKKLKLEKCSMSKVINQQAKSTKFPYRSKVHPKISFT
jgi:hypothetical protein